MGWYLIPFCRQIGKSGEVEKKFDVIPFPTRVGQAELPQVGGTLTLGSGAVEAREATPLAVIISYKVSWDMIAVKSSGSLQKRSLERDR